MRRLCIVGAVGVASSWLAASALAEPLEPPPEPGTKAIDLYLRSPGDSNSWIRPTFRADAGMFFESNAWAGNDRNLIGDDSSHWGEFGVIPGLEGQLSLAEGATLRSRFSGVFTTTQFGLDAAGSNFDDRHPRDWTLEDAYVGWASGDLFPSLGKDAIDLSVGSQPYQAGTGFLFADGGTDGGSERGGYWLGLRKAFRFTTIARLKTGPWLAEAMFLRPYDEPNTSTKVRGVNLEYAFGERAKLGGGYWNVYDSDVERRDGLDVYDLRGEVRPFVRLPGFGLAGEIVREDNSSLNNSWGGYGEVSYDFGDDVGCAPYVAYRYVSFQGDSGSGDNRAFDPLFYGFTDWNQWYLGEILGEYVATNRNANVHVVRLRANPVESVTAQLYYLYFRLDEFSSVIDSRPPSNPRAVLIQDRGLAHELDFIVDWAPNDYLVFSGVAAVLIDSSGARDFFQDDETWSHYMLYASFKF
jgi:hypothetical protein